MSNDQITPRTISNLVLGKGKGNINYEDLE